MEAIGAADGTTTAEDGFSATKEDGMTTELAGVGWTIVSGRPPVDPLFAAGGGETGAKLGDCTGAGAGVGWMMDDGTPSVDPTRGGLEGTTSDCCSTGVAELALGAGDGVTITSGIPPVEATCELAGGG